MNNLEQGKINFNLLERFPNAKKVGSGAYRVDPCPTCGGKDHFTIYEPYKGKHNNPWWTYSSFNGCCKGGSPVDYLMEFENYTQEEALSKISGETYSQRSTVKDDFGTKPKEIEVKPKKVYDFTELAEKLHHGVTDGEGMEYYVNRGLLETTLIYKLGYSPKGYNEALKSFPELNIKHQNAIAYKYFIPIWDNHNKVKYLIARHDNSIQEKQKTWNMKGMDIQLLNERYLIDPPKNGFIFVCEGWADALSIEEAHQKAIALNSTQNANKFIQLVKDNQDKLKDKIFILALDNDKAGAKAKDIIQDGLNNLNIVVEQFKFNKDYKDINEFLVSDRKGCINHINDFVYGLKDEDFTSSYVKELIEKIKANKDKPIISSGFPDLDNKLGGGVYPGLYCIGAGSSIGKTTFALQIADNIAYKGYDVLFFSLEMSKDEMVSKSLVREMFKADPTNSFIPSTRQFLNGNLNSDILLKSYEKYQQASNHIAIIEGGFNTNVIDIKNRIKQHIARRGTKPVVFVDYLQVITPVDVRMSDKQAIDFNIVELKRISREFDIPVILISSVNRANYLNVMSFESFKESGSIEYTCDVVIGLQLYAINSINEKYKGDGKLNEKRIEYNKAKSQEPRDIELVLLKNRNGVPTATCKYNYYPKYNLIDEEGDLTPIYNSDVPFKQ